MPNRKYEKGRRKEYKLCNELRESGYDIVVRTAGSHSPFDIIAVDRYSKIITLIQAKADQENHDRLFKEMEWLNGFWTVEFEVR